MADSQSKIDAAAEKAFAEAADKKFAEAVSAKAAPNVAEQVVKAAPVAAQAAEPVAAKPAPKVAKKSVRKAASTKPAPVLKKNANTEIAAATPAPSQPNAAKPTITKLKETIMATAKTAQTADYTAKAKEMAAEVQTRAKAAYDKGAEYAAEATEFSKGNLEALVTSGKILAAGLQDMGRTYVEEAKVAVETVQADVKKVAAVKTPTEFFQLQGEIARRNFDAMVATTSKNTEAMFKLVNEAFAPVSSRMSLAAEKFSKAA